MSLRIKSPASLCLLHHQRYTTDPLDSSTKKVYSCLHIVVLTQREHGWYVNNILFPTSCLTLLTFIVFAFDTKEIGGRMETAVSLLLAGACE